jgi:hypothetical protein
MGMLKVQINDSPNESVTTSHVQGGEGMKSVALKLTIEELRLLATLASDQLFRRQFIDPRMPGHRSNSEEMNLSKALVGRLRLMVDEQRVTE